MFLLLYDDVMYQILDLLYERDATGLARLSGTCKRFHVIVRKRYSEIDLMDRSVNCITRHLPNGDLHGYKEHLLSSSAYEPSLFFNSSIYGKFYRNKCTGLKYTGHLLGSYMATLSDIIEERNEQGERHGLTTFSIRTKCPRSGGVDIKVQFDRGTPIYCTTLEIGDKERLFKIKHYLPQQSNGQFVNWRFGRTRYESFITFAFLRFKIKFVRHVTHFWRTETISAYGLFNDSSPWNFEWVITWHYEIPYFGIVTFRDLVGDISKKGVIR